MSEQPPASLTDADHERIDAYLHDLMSPTEAEQFERDCEARPELKAALGRAAQRLEALQRLPGLEASEGLVRRTLAKVERRRTTRLRWFVYYAFGSGGVAAAAAIVLMILGLYYANLTPTPWDLQVFGQRQAVPGSEASLRVRLVNRSNGAAVSGVPVVLYLADGQGRSDAVKLAEFVTDENGTGRPRFRWPDWNDGEYQLQIVAQTPSQPEQLAEPVVLRRQWKLMLSTDKPVYQPGQTIHLRALALRRPDLRPEAGRQAVFRVTDPKGNIIFKRSDVTSRFGIVSADCELANEILLGNYRITCEVGDTVSEATVEVARYVLPKFKVEIDVDEPYYQPGAKVRGTVFANYFFGKPVSGSAEIEVVTQEIRPTTLRKFDVRMNRQGEAAFEFTLPNQLIGTETESGDARIEILARVTDTAGQSQERRITRIVTARPLRLMLLPENGVLVHGVPNRIYVYATYVQGRPAAGTRLKISDQPNELVTNELGMAVFEVTPQGESVSLTVTAVDRNGLTASRTQVLMCGQVPDRDFVLRTDKAVYTGGETLRLTALGAGVEPVFVDLIRDGQTVLTTTVEVRDGKGELEVDLPADLFGNVEIVAYRFGTAGLAVRKSRSIFVKQAQELKITTIMNQEEFRPGQRATIGFEITDGEGKPTPGAISLAIVDEAVFSVMSQAPGMEKTFFTLEQERLKPIYAIYDWYPDHPGRRRGRDWDDFELALFSQLAQTDNARASMAQTGTDRAARPFASPDFNSVYSLRLTTFPSKQEQVDEERRRSEDTLLRLWAAYYVMLGLILYLALWLFVRPMWIVVAINAVLLGVAGCGGVFLLVATLGLFGADKSALPVSRSEAGNVKVEAMLPPQVGQEGQANQPGEAGSTESVRVREYFPETLLWRPEIITDDNGFAQIEVDLADSITTWRLTAGAVSGDGRLGGLQSGVRVFQPFFVDLNLPVTLTRGDEVSIPVVVSNYLNQEQQVEIRLEVQPWFELVEGEAEQSLRLEANQVLSRSYRIKVKQVGKHTLQVTAKSRFVADAVKRGIEVVPDGVPVEQVVNGDLQQPVSADFELPQQAIEGSGKLLVKIYPSAFSQLIEGLEGIFRQPYGCFEQTSSTTYPNVLALSYLRKSNQAAPEVEAKARQYIHLGYQRLLGFEVPGGGFDWFGRPPANVLLTAYGLMEFQDMALVHDVDPRLITRTRAWLLRKRDPDGSWSSEGRRLAAGDLGGGRDVGWETYLTTAYVAWAVFGSGNRDDSAETASTRRYLLARPPREFDNAYVLALTCNALIACQTPDAELVPYLERLQALKKTDAENKTVWWTLDAGQGTLFYAYGEGASVEATALALLALLEKNRYPADIRAGLAWLTRQRSQNGTFGTTQGTVLALKALLAGTGKPLGGGQERRIEIVLGDHRQELVIPADQDDVMKVIDLSDRLAAGRNSLRIGETSASASSFQILFRHHVPDSDQPPPQEPLTITLDYDKTNLAVGDTVEVTARIRNNMEVEAPMVILDLPIPAGFGILSEEWEGMVRDRRIEKYQANPRSVVVYLRSLPPGRELTLRYQLQATMPVKVTVPGARVYEYYNADRQGRSRSLLMEVR
ncbi:MAG: MG2 domain-containing protein [Gemmatales bacterium]|nr:MG2 domain-containing protein [Gemmatales bacterium]MDW8386968.1 alpha-2-macroglobulin family protein [Gemmatales bacterium]